MNFTDKTVAQLIEAGSFIESGNTPRGLDFSLELTEIDKELDSRFPYFPPEYDATGQIITSELMGYTEDGEEIWTSKTSL